MFRVIRSGVTSARHLEGSRTLAEILTRDEHERVRNGTLVALTASGGLMSLDSPLSPDQVVTLRAPRPEKDLAGFGFPINRAGDIVGVTELLAIRRHEEAHGEDVYELPLDEIRARVRGGEQPGAGFFGRPLASVSELRAALHAIEPAPVRRRLPALGREAPART